MQMTGTTLYVDFSKAEHILGVYTFPHNIYNGAKTAGSITFLNMPTSEGVTPLSIPVFATESSGVISFAVGMSRLWECSKETPNVIQAVT